jgi:hypothetical protein
VQSCRKQKAAHENDREVFHEAMSAIECRVVQKRAICERAPGQAAAVERPREDRQRHVQMTATRSGGYDSCQITVMTHLYNLQASSRLGGCGTAGLRDSQNYGAELWC